MRSYWTYFSKCWKQINFSFDCIKFVTLSLEQIGSLRRHSFNDLKETEFNFLMALLTKREGFIILGSFHTPLEEFELCFYG